MTGRPSKPTSLKVLHGDRKDRVNSDEPAPSPGAVAAPGWLSESALELWDQYAPDLMLKSVLTSWDAEAFASWCDAADRRRRAVRHLHVEGEVIELPVFNKNGERTGERLGKNPWLFVLNEADGQLVRYGARFGMTPADRASLSVGDGSRDDDDDLLTGTG